MKVSVLMNCFNGSKYLEDALHSVLNQTYENWEIIFWDNNSTDNSSRIVNSILDKRINCCATLNQLLRNVAALKYPSHN